MFREITKISSKNFAKSRKFRPNFDFVFRENFAKLEENFAKFSRNYEKENFRDHPTWKTLPKHLGHLSLSPSPARMVVVLAAPSGRFTSRMNLGQSRDAAVMVRKEKKQ